MKMKRINDNWKIFVGKKINSKIDILIQIVIKHDIKVKNTTNYINAF